jgi:ribosomal protein L44E
MPNSVVTGSIGWLWWAGEVEFRKNVKITRKSVLRFNCVESRCRVNRTLTVKRWKCFELEGDKERSK